MDSMISPDLCQWLEGVFRFVVSWWCYGVWWLALVSAKLAVYSDNEDNDDDNDPVMVT